MTRWIYQPIHDDGRPLVGDPHEVCAYNWKGERWGEWAPMEVVHEVSVRPDQTLSALLADTGVDITDGRFAIVKVGEWDEGTT